LGGEGTRSVPRIATAFSRGFPSHRATHAHAARLGHLAVERFFIRPDELRDLGFDAERLTRVEASARADVEAGCCDGVALAVARHGRLALELHCGFADRAAGRTLRPGDVFASMSIGKQFTVALVLHHVERGALQLHTRVGDVLPAFARGEKAAVAPNQPFIHTRGEIGPMPEATPDVLMSFEKPADLAATAPLESRPGERVTCSILAGHAVIAAMLLRVAGRGRSLAGMLEQELFTPLGMRDTGLGPRADLVERMRPVVAGYSEPGLLHPRAVEALGRLLRVPGCEIPAGRVLKRIERKERAA
jgi:CubicO group peptidase (beta-lactamase class C family)